MELNGLFSDNMVLQAHQPVRIFGSGVGKLGVDFCGKWYDFQTTQERWCFELDAFDYGGPYEMRVCLNGKEKRIQNVYVGEVLLCIGQSNMGFTLEEEKYDLSRVTNEKVRVFVVDSIEEKPLGYKDGWLQGDNEKNRYFSAIAYHVANRLQLREKVTIGAVCCYQGASNIQSWIKKEYLTDDIFVPLDRRDMDGKMPPYSNWTADGIIFEKSFSKMIPYNVSRAIWYQGESNTSEAEGKVYLALLKRLTFCYRSELKNETLPFVIVQICDYTYRNDENWRTIQRLQAIAPQHIPYCVTVTSSDVCEHRDIHPQNKVLLSEKIADTITF